MSQERAKQLGNKKTEELPGWWGPQRFLTSAQFLRLMDILLNNSDQTPKEAFWRIRGESVFPLKRRRLKTLILWHTMTAQF